MNEMSLYWIKTNEGGTNKNTVISASVLAPTDAEALFKFRRTFHIADEMCLEITRKCWVGAVPSMTPPRGEKMTADWVKAALDDPWGSPVANDVVALLCRKIDKRIDQARKEALEEAALFFESCDTQQFGATADMVEIAKALRSLQPPREG